MDPFIPYQVELVKIADRLASQGADAGEVTYLRRFRIVYRHLAASVVGVSAESGMMAMGMGPGFPQPNFAEIMEKTDQELSGLDG